MKKAIAVMVGLVASSIGWASPSITIGVVAVGPRALPATPTCGALSVSTGSSVSPLYYVPGLADGLTQLGYINDTPDSITRPLRVSEAGTHFVLDVQQAPDTPTLTTDIQNFVQKNYNLIVAVSTATVGLAQKATAGDPIPVLFPDISDPVGSGYAVSLAQPGHNLTGVSPQLTQSTGQRLTYFQQIMAGKLKNVLVFYTSGFAPSTAALALLETAAKNLNITLDEQMVSIATNRSDVQAALNNLMAGQVDGIIMLNDTYVVASADLIFSRASELHLPIMGVHSWMAEWGAIASYPSDPYGAGVTLASYVDNIQNGANPATMAIQVPPNYLEINLDSAKCLGITVDPSLIAQANKVIQTTVSN